MLVSHRIPLTKTPVVATRVAEFRGTFYWWTPGTHTFLLKHFGVPIQVNDVHPRAIAMLVLHKGDIVVPDVKPLIPPQEPYRRAAWDFGFSAPKCKTTIERARNEIRAAEKFGGGVPPCVIDRGKFIFIYASERRSKGRVWVPYAWAYEPGTTAVEIREALKDFVR